MWLLDTNVWIQFVQNPGGRIELAMRAKRTEEIALCSIVKAELWYGAHKYERREVRLAALERLWQEFHLLIRRRGRTSLCRYSSVS